MSEVIQYRKVLGLQYSIDTGQMKIDLDGTNDNYFANLDEVNLNPKKVDMSYFEINKSVVSMKFSEPIICNVKSGRHFSSMDCDVAFDGKDERLSVENIGGLKDKLDYFTDENVEVRKDKILSELGD